MLATLTSAAFVGMDAVPVQVEVNANESGEPKLILIGLPDAAVKESADRVFSERRPRLLRDQGTEDPATGDRGRLKRQPPSPHLMSIYPVSDGFPSAGPMTAGYAVINREVLAMDLEGSDDRRRGAKPK